MSSTYIPVALRREVETRAKGCCEPCLLHADDAYFAHHVDHVSAEKHGGQTHADNLALCCAECNGHKGSDLASLTSMGRLVALFNPRRERWNTHFHIDGGEGVPLTQTGEVGCVCSTTLTKRVSKSAKHWRNSNFIRAPKSCCQRAGDTAPQMVRLSKNGWIDARLNLTLEPDESRQGSAYLVVNDHEVGQISLPAPVSVRPRI